MDYRPAGQLMAGLDRAARLLLEEPREVWQAALLPHLRPRSGRSTFAGVVGARQMLDAVLAGPCGGHAPGALVRMEDGGLAVVTGVRWMRGLYPPAGYTVMPAEVGRTETEVDTDQITAAPKGGQ